MKVMIITLLLTVGGIAYLARPHASQTSGLMIRFEVDGKEVLDPKFKVLIDVDGHQIEPDYTRQGFVIPTEVGTGQEINVRFKSGEYELFFPSIKSHNFDTEWVIGVDIPPLNAPDDTPEMEDGKKLAMVYYIEFRPHNAEGSKWIKKVYQ